MENGKKTGGSFTIGPSPMGGIGGEWKKGGETRPVQLIQE